MYFFNILEGKLLQSFLCCSCIQALNNSEAEVDCEGFSLIWLMLSELKQWKAGLYGDCWGKELVMHRYEINRLADIEIFIIADTDNWSDVNICQMFLAKYTILVLVYKQCHHYQSD